MIIIYKSRVVKVSNLLVIYAHRGFIRLASSPEREGRGGAGLAVSKFAFYTDDPSSNPAEVQVQFFYRSMLLGNNKNKDSWPMLSKKKRQTDRKETKKEKKKEREKERKREREKERKKEREEKISSEMFKCVFNLSHSYRN